MKLGEHIRKLPLGFFNRNDVGELSYKTLDNVNRVEMIITMIFPQMISTSVLSLLVASGLFFINIKMAAAMIITMPVSFIILTWARKIMHKQGNKLHFSSINLANSLLEFIIGIKHLKSYNHSDKKHDDLVSCMKEFKINSLKTEGALSPVMVLAGISIDFGLVILIMTGSYLMMGGEMSGKVFLVFMILSIRFFESLKEMAINYVKVKYLGIAGESIQNIFDEKIMDSDGKKHVLSDHNINFRDVSFSYNNHKVLEGINLDIKEKTMTAFIGPSGSGKTTMANLIARFYDVDSGKIEIGGKDIRVLDPEFLLSNISMVFQNVMLFNDTLYNNLKIGKNSASHDEIIEAARKANAHDFIQQLPDGYNTVVGENGSTLSGGELQRISIARAILKDASVILLDEATASLDPENEIYIQNAISNLLENKTIIVIAHRLKTIRYADKIVVVNNGRIVEEGNHSELVSAKGLYYDMWNTQKKTAGWEFTNKSIINKCCSVY